MKFKALIILLLSILPACEKRAPTPEIVLNEYIKSANEHNIEEVRSIYSDSITWYFGPFTFSGKEEAIQPLLFDKGANTQLTISNVKVNGDTVDFELIETNDVLSALGIQELHHFPSFVIKDGLIQKISSSRPLLEFQTYLDSVSTFAVWLSENKPEKFEQFWPGGKFSFSEKNGSEMPLEIAEWRNRFVNKSDEET